MSKFIFKYEYLKELSYDDYIKLLKFMSDFRANFSLDNLEIVDKNNDFYSWRDCLLERDSSYE